MSIRKRRKGRVHYKLLRLLDHGFTDAIFHHEAQSSHKMYTRGYTMRLPNVTRFPSTLSLS